MRDEESGSTKLRALSAALAVLAIAAGGAVWSGCGSSDEHQHHRTDGTNAQKEIEEGVKKAEEGLEKGTEEAKKGLEEAKEQIEEGKGSAKQGVEKATKEAEKGIEEGKAQAEKGIEEAKETGGKVPAVALVRGDEVPDRAHRRRAEGEVEARDVAAVRHHVEA